MGINAIVDVAIGIVLMYLVLSLLATVINEFIATGLNLRGNLLEATLAHIIDEPRLRQAFYDHGLVASANGAVGKHVSYISGKTFATAVVDSLDPTKPIPAIEDVKESLEHLPQSNIRDTLLTQLATAHGDIEQLRKNVAASFDAAMDRVSGAYKRCLKWISLGIGFALALALNADTVALGHALWKDNSIRAQLMQSAQSIVTGGAPAGAAGALDIRQVSQRIDGAEQALRPLPIGWTPTNVPEGAGWLMKLVGIAVTALALSLGAPFWFDVLSKFMNIRGAGPKPAKTEQA